MGDGIWIARHKYLRNEYVLDFIVERKKVDDLRHSIRDNRYRDQKMRLVVMFPCKSHVLFSWLRLMVVFCIQLFLFYITVDAL